MNKTETAQLTIKPNEKNHTSFFLNEYQKPDYEIKSVHLIFHLDPVKTKVLSEIHFKKVNKSQNLLTLQGENLILKSIHINNVELQSSSYKLSEKELTLEVLTDEFKLKTEVEINPMANKSCEGLYLSSEIFCTQCEADSFRKITFFLDRPDILTYYTVEIFASKKEFPILLSNGNCVEKKEISEFIHYAKWVDPHKKPCYLFALVAGDLGVIRDEFITRSQKKVLLEVYASHGKQDRCKYALKSLKKAMQWDEDKYGLEYDLDQFMIVSIDDFNMGAMENKGLNIFNSKLVLADENSATDEDFHHIESVIGHEYFHNWSGNRVTCRNWFELSLKEGLTVFRDQEFSSDMNSKAVQRIKDVLSLKNRQFVEDSGPNAHPVRPASCVSMNNLYTSTIYEKGAEVIRMMQTLVGEDGFKKGLIQFFKKYDGQAVTIIDFSNTIAETNLVDFEQFNLWYSQAGTPEVFIEESFNPDLQIYTLTLTQTCQLTLTESKEQFEKKPFHIPLVFALIDSSGNEIPISSSLIELKEKTKTLSFKVNEASKPVLSINRNFSAPIKITKALEKKIEQKELIHMIKYDTDFYNKFESCQLILNYEIKKIVQLLNQNLKYEEISKQLNSEVLDTLYFLLINTKIDNEFKSLLLTFPSEAQFILLTPKIEAEKIHIAKQILASVFVKNHFNVLHEMYLNLNKHNTAESRSLKNTILKLIGYSFPYLKDDHLKLTFLKTCLDQFLTQLDHGPMTDVLSSLSTLFEIQEYFEQIKAQAFNNQTAETLLNLFFKKWQHDKVVVNKWFKLMATSKSKKAFSTLKNAMKESAFDEQNPNNIYNTYGAFSDNHFQMQLNHKQSYEWLADKILQIDQSNPQVAARLISSFSSLDKWPEKSFASASEQIKRLKKCSQLSSNVSEILNKIDI